MWPSRSLRDRRAPALAVVLAVLAVVVAGGTGAAIAQDGNGNETSPVGVQPQAADDLPLPERVVLPGVQTHGSATVAPEAGAALDRGSARIEASYRQHLLEERVARAPDDEARRAILNRTALAIASDAEQLQANERTARRAYRDGALSDRGLLRELSSIDARGRGLAALADSIEPIPQGQGLADEVGATDAIAELRGVRGAITASQGPIRADVGAALTGADEPGRFYLTSTVEGTVLVTIDAGSYHREAHRSDLLSIGGDPGIGLSEAFRIVEEELYPVYSSHYGFSRVREEVTGRYYLGDGQGDLTYEHGVLRTYVDAVSRNAFWEYQRLDLDDDLPLGAPITNESAVPVGGGVDENASAEDDAVPTATNTSTNGTDTEATTASATQSGNLTLSVRPTYATGPASVTVTADGLPARNATIAVDGEPVGRTDGTGQVWVVLPGGDPVVSATGDDLRATVTVNWGQRAWEDAG